MCVKSFVLLIINGFLVFFFPLSSVVQELIDHMFPVDLNWRFHLLKVLLSLLHLCNRQRVILLLQCTVKVHCNVASHQCILSLLFLAFAFVTFIRFLLCSCPPSSLVEVHVLRVLVVVP